MIYLGWTIDEWVNAAHWVADQCPCALCNSLPPQVAQLIRLSMMASIAPATNVEKDAIDTLDALQTRWKAENTGAPTMRAHA